MLISPQDRFRESPFDTAIFILQNASAAATWPASDDVRVELLKAMAQGKPSAAGAGDGDGDGDGDGGSSANESARQRQRKPLITFVISNSIMTTLSSHNLPRSRSSPSER